MYAGRGAVYDEVSNGLYWTDIKQIRLHFYDLESGEDELGGGAFAAETGVCVFAPTRFKED